MSDEGLRDQSEQLDGDELGEEVGDDDLPGLGDYPPDEAQGAEDPNLYTSDDVAARTLREEPDEPAAADGPADGGGVIDLVLPDDQDPIVDHEAEALGEIGELEDGDPVPPEVAAVHVVDDLRE
jgi:hypothetical protein